jgi:ribose 5-phosphate isomerase A
MRHPASVPGGRDDPSVHAVAAQALELVADGARVGLGSGRAVSVFIAKLGIRAREGLRVSGVPTSPASATQARAVGIPLIELGEVPLDITVDGADEVAPTLDLVKGWGGALVRERIVAAASTGQVIPRRRRQAR